VCRPVQLNWPPRLSRSFYTYLTPGNGSSYACELGYLTTNSSTTARPAKPHTNHSSRLPHSWSLSLYCVLLMMMMMMVASVSQM